VVETPSPVPSTERESGGQEQRDEKEFLMPPFSIEYLCPRQANFWQPYREGIIFKTVKYFGDFQSAEMVCNSLIWQYHSAHVLDASGRVVYQV
jgi:hypothetical protein